MIVIWARCANVSIFASNASSRADCARPIVRIIPRSTTRAGCPRCTRVAVGRTGNAVRSYSEKSSFAAGAEPVAFSQAVVRVAESAGLGESESTANATLSVAVVAGRQTAVLRRRYFQPR